MKTSGTIFFKSNNRKSVSTFSIPKIGIENKEINWVLLEYNKLKLGDDSARFLKSVKMIHFLEITHLKTTKPIINDVDHVFNYSNSSADPDNLFFSYKFLNEFKKSLEESTISSIGGDLCTLLAEDLYTDLTLECEGGKRIKAHKIMLSARSEFFRRMLAGDTIESETHVVKCAYDEKTIKAMIHYFYTDQVDSYKAKDLYLAADYYQILSLKTICEQSITEDIRPENAVSTLIFAHENEVKDMKVNCIAFIKENMQKVAEAKELQNIQSKVLEKEITQYILDAAL